MNSYQAARLRPGDCVRFLDGERGQVLSIRSELDVDERDFNKLKLYRWVKIVWADGSESKIEVEDFDEIDLVASDPLDQEKLVDRHMLQTAIAESSL